MTHRPHFGALACLLLCLGSFSAAARPALWVVRDADTTIYLFGTVHLLPDDTHWHDAALDKALAASQSLTIEITDDDAAHMQALVLQYGLDPAHPLSDQLTAAENARMTAAAQAAGLPGGTATLQIMRPWLAALTLSVAPFVKAGLDPEHGVDKQLKAQMLAAGKPVNGLETARQQIQFFADLPQAAQLEFLRATLKDVSQEAAELKALIGDWKNGDTDAIARIEESDLRQQSPELYQRLLVQRNEAWARKIKAMLAQPGTLFIAVGAAHLAGPDSVQSQLRHLGLVVQRL